MGFRLKLLALHVHIDFLVAKAEGFAADRWRAAHKALQIHAHHTGVKVHASIFVGSGQNQMVQVIDHVGFLGIVS